MGASSPLRLVADDKLDLLRYLDEFHYWHSLDDKRRCKRCSREITGHQILVFEVNGTRGRMRLQCPTVACVSTPSEWVYADPFLAASLRRDFQPATHKLAVATASLDRTHHGHACSVRRRKRRGANQAEPQPVSVPAPPVFSFRTLLERLALLRPIAAAREVIHPVARV